MRRTSRVKFGFGIIFLLLPLLACGVFLAAPAPAHAGLYDRVRDIFELPGEVDKLKESYDSALQQLEETKRQAEAYREMQEQVMADNARLLEQNRMLTEMVETLRKSEEAREKQSSRIQRIIWTLIGLVAGYFILSRAARFLMRARQK